MNSTNIDVSRHGCWKQIVLWLPQERKVQPVVPDFSIHLKNAHCRWDQSFEVFNSHESQATAVPPKAPRRGLS